VNVSPIALTVNGRAETIEADPQTPLLWVLRDNLNLTGTKFGCGRGLCAACTVHVNGRATRSCITPVSTVQGKQITTIEGLSSDPAHLSAVQQAWIDEQVPQCGYCQSGFIMAAAELLARKPQPTDEDINEALSGNLCRCGTYVRIRRAVHRAAEIKRAELGLLQEGELA
jgi:isoquinoline 1-oxidoreductase alpha subunit